MARVQGGQPPLPVQPVLTPVICNPYEEPARHWVYESETGAAREEPGRRPASFWFQHQSSSGATAYQRRLILEEERDELPLVNALRADVKRWRERGYEGATYLTKELLAHWRRADRPRRLFFCQIEAVETVVYLNELLIPDKVRHQTKLEFSRDNLHQLRDIPADPALPSLTRMGVKMATGSGKTVVMAMVLAWAFCNHAHSPADNRFPGGALVVCPNLTVKERLQVLRPEQADNYYATFDLVPARRRPLLQGGKVLVENWHAFLPESEHSEGGKSYAVVNKGPEGADAFARRTLGDLYERAPLLVLNDEAHHAWRPPRTPAVEGEGVTGEGVTGELKAEIEEATVWVNGLDQINSGVKIRCCIDLSATPFYVAGSGYVEGSPFPWLVSDFGLVDAIESGIVKIPRLPIADTTGAPDPHFYRLWEHIDARIQPGERLPGKMRKPKPEAVYREAQSALLTLASQWQERFTILQQATPGQDRTPPVLIVVCDNTDLAEHFFRMISGEAEEEVEEIVDDKPKKGRRTTYSESGVLPEFTNRAGFRPTIRIDSKLLAQAESGDPAVSKQDAAEQLRTIVATVGKRGEPGEQVRCVVSVAMLTEGWDATNVTHILGLRAFGSQLLCEQVVGRGLRRMDYVPDPETGLLAPEYVDIYGVPFSLIPFRGRKTTDKAPEDRPSNHVRALEERAAFEMRFPVVEGYAFALRRNLITADIDAMAELQIDPLREPTAVFVSPQVGYNGPTLNDPFQFVEHDREEFYRSTHVQAIEFLIARQVVWMLTENSQYQGNADQRVLRLQSRHRLFPEVLRLAHSYIARKVRLNGADPRELGLQVYFQQVVSRLLTAIRPDATQGESPLLPILNRYKPQGTTAEVDFKTIRPCFPTKRSHINQVAADTLTWEQAAAFRLEQAAEHGIVQFYARNDGLGFLIPYEFLGGSHHYEPDFLVRLANDVTLILEIKGMQTAEDQAKQEAARRWCDAVNHWGELGRWEIHICRNPAVLLEELRRHASAPTLSSVTIPNAP